MARFGYVAAQGWEHAAWSGTYYPEDLPAEWRLTYYANEFPAVVVPATAWGAAPEAQARQWYADTPEGFGFLLEGTPPAGVEAALAERLVAAIGPGEGDLPRLAWPGAGEVASAGGIALTRLGVEAATPPALRVAWEALSGSGAAAGFLVIEGEAGVPEALERARTVAELMGL
ncbi:MAG: DUF72 domain-containing protein [Pseudomonadota bacterium]